MAFILDVLSQLNSADINIDQQRCVRVRNRNASCRRCADACVSGCISYEDNQLRIEPGKCIGCATCASVCPADALFPKKISDEKLHADCLAVGEANDGRVVIACQDILNAADGLYDSARVASVPCLGRVDCSLLLRLAADGAAKIILVQGACDRCENSRGVQICANTIDTVNTLLETWNCPIRVEMKTHLPGYTRARKDEGFDRGRRAFLFSAKEEAKNAAMAMADVAMKDVLGEEAERQPGLAHVDAHGTLPHSVSQRREVLLASLDVFEQHWGGPEDMMIDVPLWSEVLIDLDECNACRMCATFCPTGANFKFKTTSGKIGVKHQVNKCVNCGLCADICPTGALSYSPEVFARDISEGTVERFLMADARADTTHDTMQASICGQMKSKGTFVTSA